MTRRRELRIASIAAFACLVGASLAALQKDKVGDAERQAQPRSASGLILGRVVDAATNRPLDQAIVTLLPAISSQSLDAPPPAPTATTTVLTDSEGRFLFRSLAAGSYFVRARAVGYLEGGFGQRRPGGAMQPFALAQDQRTGDVTIRIWKEAGISGRVTDETGAPLSEVWVHLLRRAIGSARGSWRTEAASALVRTDDRGDYHFNNVNPGEYVVSVPSRMAQWPVALAGADPKLAQELRATGTGAIATTSAAIRLGDMLLLTTYDGVSGGSNLIADRLPATIRGDGRVIGYATTFHPSATDIGGATPIEIRSGDARADVNVELRAAPMGRVSGTLLGPAGPAANFGVHLIPAFAANRTLERTHESALTITDPKGSFTFLAVPAGQYVLKAWRLPPSLVIDRDALPAEPSLWAEMPIAVGETGLANVQLTLRPGAVVSGRVQLEGSATSPNPAILQTTLSVAFEPAWPLAFAARLATRVTPAFEFSVQGLPPGLCFVNMPNNFTVRGWNFESATHAGKDLLMTPLVLDAAPVSDVVITFSDRRSELSGTITDNAGRPDSEAAVVLFPADYRAWIANGLSALATRAQLATQSGRYSFPVRPGDYLVAAVSEEVLAVWPHGPTVEKIVLTATRVSIARGESRQQDLRRGGR